MLESKQTSINVRQKLSYPWLHIFSQVFCSSSRLLKIRGIFGIYALLILSDISLLSTKYMINFAEMSFYVNNDNALFFFLFLFYLEGEQVFVQLQVQGTLSLQLVFVICQSFFSLDNISSNSINYKSGDLHNLPWMRMLKSQILATCCQRTASSKVGGKDGFAENFIIKGILKICADNNGLLD